MAFKTFECNDCVDAELIPQRSKDPIDAIRAESVGRMKTAMLSASIDDPYAVSTAIKQVTLLRVHHQVSRIIQYLDMLDKLESKFYQAMDIYLDSCDVTDTDTLSALISLQNRIQTNIIESNKLLAPYLELEKYPVFAEIQEVSSQGPQILDMPASKRQLLRESARDILTELEKYKDSDMVES